MAIEIHKVKEIYPGVFHTILDFPRPELAIELLADDFPWVLVWSHVVSGHGWEEASLPVTDMNANERVRTFGVQYDLLLETDHAREILVELKQSINLVQLKSLPPKHFPDISKIQGRERYRLLGEIGWNYACDIPGQLDYANFESPNQKVVHNAIELVEAGRD